MVEGDILICMYHLTHLGRGEEQRDRRGMLGVWQSPMGKQVVPH